MAYAAVISLEHTFDWLVNFPRILLVPPSPEIIQFAQREVMSLKRVLKTLDMISKSSSRKRVNVLDEGIREAVSKFEYVVESHVLNQIASQSEETTPLLFSIDLQDLESEIRSMSETLKKMKDEYDDALYEHLPEEEEEEAAEAVSEKTEMMVGSFNDFYKKVKDYLVGSKQTRSMFIPVTGMAGVGKTTLAREILEDPDVSKRFDLCGWVTVGRKCKPKEIPRAILAQLDPNVVLPRGHKKIAECLEQILKGKRYLVVLDDVWDTSFWRSLFPEEMNGSRVLITTRLGDVAYHADMFVKLTMPLLNEEESWHLFCDKAFDQGLCPPKLEKVGKKIAEKCEGLPLMIIAVARRLREVDMTVERWNMVLEDKDDQLFPKAYDEISKVLFPSYDYLPQHLKACFLYLAIFPQGYNIHTSKLFQLWIAEEFPDSSYNYPENTCYGYLSKLVSNSVVYWHQKVNYWDEFKTCRLHSTFWQLCKKESRKTKFFHLLSRLVDCSKEDLTLQRRLGIHNNVLFGIKEACASLEEYCASTSRALQCYGPYHPYPVPICFELRLLRVLDARAIRLYDFPMQVLKRVLLRYLGLTCHGSLPPCISKLWNLQFLIVGKHWNIKFPGAPSYLPLEIWDMKELKHIQVTGSDLLAGAGDSSLENLVTLLNVSSRSCTERIFQRIPNLRKLRIVIELAPDDDCNQRFGCFDHISLLDNLNSLKCSIVNPEIMPEIIAPPAPLSIFPASLTELSLSGMGYPWEEMRNIASLQLTVLKLKNYAFRGPEWDLDGYGFFSLKVLLIEDTDLVQWSTGGSMSTMELRHLIISHCYNLKEIEGEFPCLTKIEVVDSNPLAATWAKKFERDRLRENYNPSPQVVVLSSWEETRLDRTRKITRR